MVRKHIIRLYKECGYPLPFAEIRKRLGLSSGDLELQLQTTDMLSGPLELNLAEVSELIQFYGRGTLFSQDFVDEVEQYFTVRDKIRAIEKKAGNKGEN